jgi:DNA-binding GntR family transcriptional regulator
VRPDLTEMGNGAKSQVRLSLAERAYQTLKDAIITGTLRPGELIVERELAHRYQMGKTPIREGLHALQQEGLVEAIPRAGYMVSAITTRDVQELFEVRSILETAAAGLAATSASEEELQRLQESADFKYTHGDWTSYKAFLNANTEFHFKVAQASGNERLAQIVLRLVENLERLFHLELDLRDSAEEMVAEHKALVAALIERDPQKARQVMADQIRASRDRALEAIVSQGAGPVVEI